MGTTQAKWGCLAWWREERIWALRIPTAQKGRVHQKVRPPQKEPQLDADPRGSANPFSLEGRPGKREPLFQISLFDRETLWSKRSIARNGGLSAKEKLITRICLSLTGYLVGLGVLLGVGGCRTNPQVALLELENRLLEDRIYELEAQLAKQAEQLANCQQQQRQGGAQMRGSLPAKGVAAELPAAPSPSPSPYTSPSPPSEGGKQSGRGAPPLPSLQLQLPEKPLPPGQLPKRLLTPPGESSLPAPSQELKGPPLKLDGAGNQKTLPSSSWPPKPKQSLGRSENPPLAPPAGKPRGWEAFLERLGEGQTQWASYKGGELGSESRKVCRIQILPGLTGGYDLDGQPGDEGISLALRPMDAEGQTVFAAAPVSIVVIDPAFSDQSGRVARWDLRAEQIAALSQQLPQAGPLRMVLLWPGEPPRHNRLHLFVRYITADGRKLQADMPLKVDVEGRKISLNRYTNILYATPQISRGAQPESLPAPLPGANPPSSAGSSAVLSGRAGQPEPLGGAGGSVPEQTSPSKGSAHSNLPFHLEEKNTPAGTQPGQTSGSKVSRRRIPWKPTR